MTFNFPKTRYADINGIVAQATHIYSEALEVQQAVFASDMNHTAEEIMDCLHSCETALRILQERYNINLNALRMDVERKNMERGYYSSETEVV